MTEVTEWAWMNGPSPSWLMMPHLGASGDGAAMLRGLELGRSWALVLSASPGKG